MYDFALIHLQAPMRVNGSTTGYVRELSELSLQDMMNVNVAVYGRGMNVLAVERQAATHAVVGRRRVSQLRLHREPHRAESVLVSGKARKARWWAAATVAARASR